MHDARLHYYNGKRAINGVMQSSLRLNMQLHIKNIAYAGHLISPHVRIVAQIPKYPTTIKKRKKETNDISNVRFQVLHFTCHLSTVTTTDPPLANHLNTHSMMVCDNRKMKINIQLGNFRPFLRENCKF